MTLEDWTVLILLGLVTALVIFWLVRAGFSALKDKRQPDSEPAFSRQPRSELAFDPGWKARALIVVRRTAARRLRALGMSDRDIAELVGWGTVAMVQRYLGKDPKGVAARLRARLIESGRSSRTWPAHGGFKASEA